MIKLLVYLLAIAFIHAKLEIQIEGERTGWAHRLPCWRINNKLTQLILGKELTGYHFYLIILFFAIFHSPFLFINWTFGREIMLFGLFCWYWVCEDIFWFIENKVFGLRNFKKGRIFWHKRWFLRLPVSYWFGIIIGAIFYILGAKS